MADNKRLQQVYDALKADGQFSQTKDFATFAKRMNERGYSSMIWRNLKDAGANVGENPWKMRRWLGIQEFAPKPKQQATNQGDNAAQQSSQTTAQKAMALQQQSKQQKQVVNPNNVDYLSRPKATPYVTQKKKEPKGKVSAFVQGLYDQEDMQREQETHQPITYTSKGAFKQMAGNRKNAQQQAMNAAVTQATGEEAARRNQPIVKTETPADDYVVKTEGQLEDEVAKSAEGFVNNNMANYISDAVKKEQDASLERAVAAADRVPAAAGLAGGMSLMSKGRSFNEQLDTDAMAKRLVKSVSDNVQTLFSNPEYAKKIEDEAARLGISTDAYIQSIVPSLQEKLASQLTQSEYMKSLPTNTAEYFLETALDANSLGKYIRMAVQTKGQRIAHEQAMAQTREGKNPNYKPGIVTDVAANVLGMSTDPIFRGAAGMGGKASKAAFGNVASKIANSGNIFQKAGYIAGSGVVSGGVTGMFFGAHNAVLENYSTGDDTSLGNTLRLATTGALSEGASWSLMGLMGAPLNVAGRKIGLTGAERTASQYLKAGTAKVSLAAGSTIMEALGMNVGGYAAARIEGQKDADGNPVKLELVNGTLETLPTVIGFRLAHAKDLFSSRKGKDGKKLPWYQSAGLNLHDALLSDETKSASLKFTDDEKQQLFGSGAKLGLTAKGKDIFKFGKETKKFNPEDVEMAEDGSDLLNYYQQMMLDPNVSWDAKNKFSAAVMGVFSNSRPMRDYVTFTVERVGEGEQDLKKYVNEYAKDGTLISKTSYDSNEARGVILYRQNAMYEHNRLYNAWGVAIGKDSEDREMQRQFLLEKGYDVNNNPENTSRNMELIAGMNDKESDLYKEFMGYVRENGTVGKVTKTLAEQFGTKEDTIEKAIFKDPMKRTELENNIAIAYRRALEAEAFPSNKPHEEQSHLQGKDVAEDNNLGTEQPNSQAVIDELNNLKEAEDNLTKAMESNDTFKQIFEDGKKQGMRNADIYAALLQNGVTADEAAPLAEYMNANARVQGMQQATQQKIEQNVSAFVDDWAFKGTYNGEKIDGKNVIRVQDEYGRVLIVANGDMAFDETNGKAKEGVGDLLICYDENNKQTVYAKVEDVTLFSNEDAEAYKAKEIERLQNINSVPYNEAARAQAEADAAKAQQEGGGEGKPDSSEQKSVKTISDEQEFANETNSPDKISEEKDEWGKPLVKASDGSTNYGEISDGYGLKAAPIRLSLGENKKNPVTGKDEGYGLLHIIARHGDQIRKAGYKSVEEFVEAVSKGYTEIREGVQVGTTQTYLIVKKDGHANTLYIELSRDGKYWNVNSAGIFKEKYVDRKKEIKPEPTVGSSTSTDTTGVNHGQSEGAAVTSGNSPMTSGGKGTNNSSNDNTSETTLTFKNGEKVPMKQDSKGRPAPDYDKMTPAQSAEVLHSQFKDSAEKVADARIKKAKEAVKKAEKIKVDYDAEDDADILEQEAAKAEAIKAAQENLEKAEAIKKALTALQVDGDNVGVGTVYNTNKYDVERKQGYRIGEGNVRYDRQKPEDVGGTRGKEISVAFSPTVEVKGHAKLVELNTVQASHSSGKLNPYHFGHDWQPKNRNSQASKIGADKMAETMNPEKITGNSNAFIESAPSVNERHECIQGNNRIEALKIMYSSYPEQAAKYKQYLIDHAAKFGFDPQEIAKMKKPVIVSELPVDDATAKQLGQMTVDGFETGGSGLPDVNATINKLVQSGKVQNFINKLFDYSGDEDLSFSELVSRNADKALRILSENGIINNTGLENLMKDPTERRTWIEKVLKTSLFDGEKDTEMAFDSLPSKAQKAILSTFMRDAKSPETARVKQNLKNSFMAYNELNSSNESFKNAKNINEARAVINGELTNGNQSMFEEEPVRERYSTFELELAVLYKGLKDQKTLTGLFNDYFDAVQGDKVSGREFKLEETPREPISKEEALKEVFESYDTKPAESQQQVDEAVKSIATEITKGTGVEVVTGEEAQEALDEAEEWDDKNIKFQRVTDKDEIVWLESQELFPMYSAVQVVNGDKFPPMAKIINGKSVDPLRENEWDKSVENPDLVKEDGTFTLQKTDGPKTLGLGDVDAAYNPYNHLSSSTMNDQFTGAYARGNIRVARWLVPKSELTSGYHAEKAKDSVGMLPWHSGAVNGLLPRDRQRQVMLSRWRKLDVLIEDSEVAERVSKQIEGTDLALPWNVFTPNQIRELAKLGTPITIQESGSVAKVTKDAFLKQKAELEKEFPQAQFVDKKMTQEAYLKWGTNEGVKADIKARKKEASAKRKAAKKAALEDAKAKGAEVKEFRSKDGEVYGFTDGEKIYLDTKKMKPETPLHEYTHLWTEALKRGNPKEWENVKKLFDEVEGLKEEVQKLYPELKGEDLYEEMITTYSGREGAKKLETVARELAAKDGKTVTESAKAQGFLDKVKTALQKYWKGVADMLHIHFTTAEEVADKVLADWAKGVNPNEIKGAEKKDDFYDIFDDGTKDAEGDGKGEGKDKATRSESYRKFRELLYDYQDDARTFPKEAVEEELKRVLKGLTKEELDEAYKGLVEHGKEHGGLDTIKVISLVKSEIDRRTSDPMEALNNATEAHREEKLDAARKAYEEAKKSGNEEQRTKAILDLKRAYLDKINSKEVKKKDEAWNILAEAEELLAEHRGLVYDEHRGSRTKSATIDKILTWAESTLDKITDEPVDPATEKQESYINKMLDTKTAGDDLWSAERSALEGMKYNKFQASKLIDRIKFLNNMDGSYTKEDIDRAEKEIRQTIDTIRERNGAKPFDWEKKDPNGKLHIFSGDGNIDKTFHPIEAAAEDFKKEHPITEDEIMGVEGLDDESKYTAIDYLNGEDDSEVARICYEQAYNNRKPKKVSVKKVDENADKKAKPSKPRTKTGTAKPKVKTVQEKKDDAKKFREERDKETSDLMQQFLAAANKKDSGSGKAFSTIVPIPSKAAKWMEKNLTLSDEQKVLLPKLLTAIKGSMYARIKEGVYNLEDVIENVRKDFKAFFSVLSEDDANKILAEAAYKGRYTDPETKERMRLSEFAERERKLSPEHRANLFGDSKLAEEKKQKENTFIGRVKEKLDKEKSGGIREMRKLAEECGMEDVSDTDLQELAETAVVQKVRDIATSRAISNEKKFEAIKVVYENQPSLNQRDSERVMKQQYSTPAPYAFLADMYVTEGGKNKVESALEPSAGNGMLTIGLPKDKVHVNDIDDARLANLRRQGFKNISNQDGTQPFVDKDVDVVVTNPPFGSATTKEYDGYKISSLEGQMAINALESMKDGGRAAIIIGGTTEYASNGSLKPKDKAFLGYLYSHYNVEDVINVDGSLYAKQGTTYPTRIILINGRRKFDPEHKVYPPVEKNARAETVKDYDELFKRINDDLLRSERMDSSIGEGTGKANSKPNRPSSSNTNEEGVRMGGRKGSEQKPKNGPNGVSGEPSLSESDNGLGNKRGAEREAETELLGGNLGTDGTGTESSQSEDAEAKTNNGRRIEGGIRRSDSQPATNGTTNSGNGERPRGQLQRVDKPIRELTTEKVSYAPKSGNPFTLKAVMPADQQDAVSSNLEKLGDADQFLVDELGYNDKNDLYSHLAAEQVDSVALALRQAKQGNAFIIGDQTGIGKGRQAASLIRYAKKQGQVPVYFTKTAGLLSDVYRDLVDIGSQELRPFVFGSVKEAAITDSEGKVIFPLPSKSEVQRVLEYIEKNEKLPDEYDYVLTTYSQVSNGIFEFDEKGNRKERKIGKNKKFGAAAYSGQRRRDAIEKLVNNGYLILDESHTAGGDSGQGNYFQHIIQKTKNVTFFSATFAKRPDNMPIYALRTAMNKSGMETSDLIDAVKRGGATLQEIMSQTLTECGQMIRRERDMTGVTIDWKAIDEPKKVQEQREQYDSIIGLFNDIINFQKAYVSSYIDKRNEELAETQSSMGITRGAEALGIKNVPFASKAFNTVQQVLLSLKAKSAAERAIDYLKQGMKPVIALNNTNESQTEGFAIGEEMDTPDLGTSLIKGLEGTLRYTEKDAKDESNSGFIKLEDLGEGAIEAYYALEKKIKETSTGLSLSPIDVIKNELEKAGYKVGELTGRNTEFVYNENGTVTKMKRTDTDKKKLAREFNDGQIDALILNKSAATGISLHASSKYKDQRKRVMIVAQQQLDVNDEVQMRGRIDRTGQVARGAYEYVVSLIPAEQRLLMMFKAKLKSLDANTTSSQKSKFNEMEVADITNKYGDKVVREYMAEHLDLYAKMADPFGWEKAYGDDLTAISTQNLVSSKSGSDGEAGADASKLLGRMALLKVSEQEKMLNEIGELYTNEIRRLNEMGENDLEITELPLKAKTISKEVWAVGSEPDSDNAFADNTYIEKVNMAILKKPMKADEVRKAQEGLVGGKSWEEYREEKKSDVKAYFDKKIAEENQKYEERAVKAATKAKEKYQKDAKRQQKDSGLTDAQIEQMSGYQYDNIYKQEKDKLNDAIKNLKAKEEEFERVLDTFNTDDAYVLPVDMNDPNELSGFGNSYGRLIDIKITDNFSPNASNVSFATLDGRRKITFPITGRVGSGDKKADVIAAIDRLTRQASSVGDKNLRVLSMDVNNWDRLVSNESRKDGYIITGNLLQAMIDTKKQAVGGQLVKYTTEDGEIKTGILMPDRFEPKSLSNEYPISIVAEKFGKPTYNGGIDEVVSSDGNVKIKQCHNGWRDASYYEIRVPKSSKKGGKYFLDKELLSMIDGENFETRGNSMLGEFKEEQLRPVLARLSNLGVKVKEERQSSEGNTHFRTDGSHQENEKQDYVSRHIVSVAQKVGSKVNMAHSIDEITNADARKAVEEGRPVTGWYDEATGQVHLYMPNIHDSYTAEKTIWHETVGHKGMRELFGDKFDKFLDSVWYDLDKPENTKLKELVMDELKKNPFDYRNAIEEGVARLAEEGKGEPGFWRNIKNKMVDLMHEIGYRIAPNTKDVKYLLWLSKNLQKHPNDVSWRLKADAVKYKLDKENTPEVITRDGIFRDNDGKTHSSDLADMPKKEYQEATDGQVHFRTAPSLGTAIDRYHRALNAHGYMATESFMDNMLSLDKLMRAIDPSIKKIEDVESSRNPYILQNTMQGAMSNAAEQFEMHVMKPLDKAMADLLGAFDGRKADDMIRNFNLYMITKHGLERNRVFFVRDYIKGLEEADAKALQRQWNAEKKDLGDKLNNGSVDLKSYYDEMDEWIRNNVDKDYDASENDYSGLHGVQGIKDSKQPYDDAAAIDSVMSAEAKMEGIKTGSVKDFWSKVRTATDFALGSDYKNGIVSKDNHDNVSAMFDWYVPLRKFDKDTAEDVYGYITEKGKPSTYIGSTLMNAKGRKSLSETNVLAQIGAMGNAAINRGGQNAIKQAFMRFIRANSGNGLVTESKVWAVYDGTDASGNPIWREAYPDIPEDAAPDEIAKIVSDFETDMKAKQAIGDAKVIRNHRDVKFKFERAKDANQHVVDVMVNGSTVRFYVNGNPRAAQALNGMLENQGTIWLKPVASITRTMAQLCTSYSPEFVVRNIVRDAEFAFSNIAAKENSSYRRTWEEYYVGLIGKGIGSISFGDLKGSEGLGLYAKYNNGTLDMSNKVHRYFKEFMENGGETGWVQVLSMKDWEKKYKTDVKTERSKINKGGEMLKDFFLGNLKNINEAAENMARFATYCASRDAGRSAVRSAYDAKEVSTNFNRHGSGDRIWSFKNGQMGSGKAARQKTYGFLASYLRQCSMFFNAGIQSTNLLMKNSKHAAKGTATVMTGIPFAMGIAAALVNNWLIASEDEKERKGVKDPYGELPEYVRRNNLCIYKGNGEFVTIPLAIELRAFYGVGDLAAGLTFSKNIKTTRPAWADAVGCLSQLVPIMDYTNSHTVDNSFLNETLKAFSPSAFAPLVEWGLNSDWKGAPIRREKTSYNEYAPAWTRAYKNTPKVFMDMNKKANAMTNDLDKGNENLLGWNALDAGTDPSAWNHFLGGFGGGMATFATRVTKLATSLTDSQKPETSDIPFVRSFLYEPNEQSSIARTKSKWYNYIEDMKKDMSNIQTLKKRTVSVDQLVHNYAAYYKIKNSPKAQMAQVIEQAESQMKQLKQMRDKSSDPAAIDNANKTIDNIMMRAVEQLDQLSSAE